MLKEFCVLSDSDYFTKLKSLIKTNYKSDNTESLQQLNMNNIKTSKSKLAIKDLWHNIEDTVGYKIAILHNLIPSSAGSLAKGYSIIINDLKAETGLEIANNLHKATAIQLTIKNIEN